MSGEQYFLASNEAVFCLITYLFSHYLPERDMTVEDFYSALLSEKPSFSEADKKRLGLLKAALRRESVKRTVISDASCSREGLCAAVFMGADGRASVVFRGTGSDEWIDNGRGLSGVAEENTYNDYGKGGNILATRILAEDFASDRQAEAVNFFRTLCANKGWSEKDDITLSGHSKGGNKAQFVTMLSPLVSRCFSFDGQGFSPEAVANMYRRLGKRFAVRKGKIHNISSYNDYINVLGVSLASPENTHYLCSSRPYHGIEAILDSHALLTRECKRGQLSLFAGRVSDRLMALPPDKRSYATVGVMSLFDRYLGDGNGKIPTEKTLAGLWLAVGSIIAGL